MRQRLTMLAAVALAGLFLAGCSGDAGKPPAGAGKPLKVAVIPKGTVHVFWKSVQAGAVKAGKELPNVSVIWQGTFQEDDRRAQIDLVETFIQKRVDAIVLAPLDDKALIEPVRAAKKAGIAVVIFDSDLADPEAYVSFVATDNFKGGRLGAQCLAKCLGEKGKVILLRYQVGSASNENREDGFIEEMARHAGIQVISSDQHAGTTVESAMNAAQSLLAKYGEGQVDGIFCPNEPVTHGMLRALETSGRAGRIKLVGFDASERLIEGMKKGAIHGLVLQDPVRIGHDGVATAVAYLRGRKVEKRVDTGVIVVTPENLDDPKVQQLVHPALD